MNKKVVIVLGVGLLGAVVSTYLFYRAVSSHVSQPASEVAVQRGIVVAAADLPRGRVLSTGDLRIESWSGPSLPPGAFAQPVEVLGETLRRHLSAGEIVSGGDLLAADANWLASRIPEGKRGVSIHVDEFAGVTQLLRVGDRVDVLVASQPRQPGQRSIQMKTLLEDVEVIATGREPLMEGHRNAIPVVTLLVETEDSEALSLADQSGSIRLALRGPFEGGEELMPDKALTDSAATGEADDRAQTPGSASKPRAQTGGNDPSDVALLKAR